MCEICNMNVLSVERISKSFGVRELFEDLSFGIEYGQKVALVAKNGTGKSTLLQLLSGKDTPDSGSIVFNKDIRFTFLEQDEHFQASDTALDFLLASNNNMTAAIRAYDLALATGSGLEQALDVMDQTGAWDYDSKMKQVLGALNILKLDQPMGTMSGGQRRRIALAKVLLEDADFLILDEPTNHLDLDMIEWLEDYLGKSNKTIFMVTHDRYFLENITDEILELENKTLYRYKGNFTYYLEKKSERELLESATRDKQENLFRKEAEWARKMPRARGTKSKSRLDAFVALKETLSKKQESGELELEINISRLGSKVVEFHKVKKQLGDQVILNDFNYTFKSNERVGLVGRNGCGKTTFLQLLTKRTEPDNGKVVNGDTVVFGFYEQSTLYLKPEQRVIECIREIADFIPLKKGKTITASQLLEKFLFPKSMHFNTINQLSGGEKKRLQLLLVLMKNPNFLILDEPTNDLDIFTLSALEDYLSQYTGCLLIVSHDRYFLDKLVDHLFVLDGMGNVKDVLGSSLQFREILATHSPESSKIKQIQNEKTKGNSNSKISYKEKLLFEQLDKDIPRWEEERSSLESKLSQSLEHNQLIQLSEELAQLNAKIEQGTMQWMELAEKIN
jgi:ABC transport system ATP-binding/permease protein